MGTNIWLGEDPTDPNDWSKPANWSAGVPTDGDVVYVPMGTPSILVTLDQTGTKLDGFRVELGYTSDIGSPKGPLKIKLKVDDFQYEGTGTAFIDVSVDAPGLPDFSPVIGRCGKGATGTHGLVLSGQKIKTLQFNGTGKLGVGTTPGDTLTRVETVEVSGAGSLDIGPGVQASAGDPDLTVSNVAATVNADCDMYEVDVFSGVYRQRAGFWHTARAHAGTIYASGDSGSANLNTEIDAEGALYNNENNTGRSFTNVTITDGGTWMDPAGTGTYTNVDFPTGMGRCTLDFGRDKRLTVADIP